MMILSGMNKLQMAILVLAGILTASAFWAVPALMRAYDPLAAFTNPELGAALQAMGLPLPTCANSIPEGCKSARDRIAEGRAKFATIPSRTTRKAIMAWYDVAEQGVERGEKDEQVRYRIQNALKAVPHAQ